MINNNATAYKKWRLALLISFLSGGVLSGTLLSLSAVIEILLCTGLALLIIALGGASGSSSAGVLGWLLFAGIALVLPFPWNAFLYAVALTPLIFLPALILSNVFIFKHLKDLYYSDKTNLSLLLGVATVIASMVYLTSGVLFTLAMLGGMGLLTTIAWPMPVIIVVPLMIAMPLIWLTASAVVASIAIGLARHQKKQEASETLEFEVDSPLAMLVQANNSGELESLLVPPVHFDSPISSYTGGNSTPGVLAADEGTTSTLNSNY